MHQRAISILLLAGLLIQLQGCYMPRVLSHHDLEYESRKDQVDFTTEYNGLKSSDRILSYTNLDGKEIPLPSLPVKLKIQSATVYNDSLILKLKTKGKEDIGMFQSIPLSDIQTVKVRRYLRRPTVLLSVAGVVAFFFILPYL